MNKIEQFLQLLETECHSKKVWEAENEVQYLASFNLAGKVSITVSYTKENEFLMVFLLMPNAMLFRMMDNAKFRQVMNELDKNSVAGNIYVLKQLIKIYN